VCALLATRLQFVLGVFFVLIINKRASTRDAGERGGEEACVLDTGAHFNGRMQR